MKNASKTTILPPPSEEAETLVFPKPARVPEIKTPTEEELEERSQNTFIYDRDQFLVNLLLKHRRYQEALDEIEREIEDHDASKKKTEIYHKSNSETMDLLKSCDDFFSLCIKK